MRDDGVGTEPTAIQKILQQKETTDKIYALKNVNDRIHLKYGEGYGVQFDSTPEKELLCVSGFQKRSGRELRMKILIADDERHIRNGLGSNIDWKFLGIDTVFTAEDGVAAERICSEHRPEIIISDIRMPGIDGLELAERAIEGYGARKVILLSGYSEFEYAKKAISIGVVEYLLKPVNLDKLTDLLAKA